MSTLTQTQASQGTISPVDALWTLIQSQTKAVRKALAKRILDEEQAAKSKQEAMLKESFTKAFDELQSGKAKHDARALFKEKGKKRRSTRHNL